MVLGDKSISEFKKNKPDKYVIKLFLSCEAESGYVLKVKVYTWKACQDNSVTCVSKTFTELFRKEVRSPYIRIDFIVCQK